jgi:hypothetical protein
VSAWTGLEPTMSSGGVAIVTPAGADVVEAEATRTAVKAIRCLEFGTDGTGRRCGLTTQTRSLGVPM